jgi:hypothetical protein
MKRDPGHGPFLNAKGPVSISKYAALFPAWVLLETSRSPNPLAIENEQRLPRTQRLNAKCMAERKAKAADTSAATRTLQPQDYAILNQDKNM